MFKQIFAKLKFSPALFEKILSFVCLVFKIENKYFIGIKFRGFCVFSSNRRISAKFKPAKNRFGRNARN